MLLVGKETFFSFRISAAIRHNACILGKPRVRMSCTSWHWPCFPAPGLCVLLCGVWDPGCQPVGQRWGHSSALQPLQLTGTRKWWTLERPLHLPNQQTQASKGKPTGTCWNIFMRTDSYRYIPNHLALACTHHLCRQLCRVRWVEKPCGN